jgi:uncharacterized tellurite resistance protein B-like protein
MNETLDLAKVSESDRLAFYGALSAVAFADGSIDQEEFELLYGMIDLEGMTESAKRKVQSYITEPPLLEQCVQKLSGADKKLRNKLMVNILEIVYANDKVDVAEKKMVLFARENLNISMKEFNVIVNFVKERKMRRHLEDNYGAAATETSVEKTSKTNQILNLFDQAKGHLDKFSFSRADTKPSGELLETNERLNLFDQAKGHLDKFSFSPANTKPSGQLLEMSKVPESDRLAFYGALFAIAFVDGSIDKEELQLIYGMMDLEGMTESAKQKVQSYIMEPLNLSDLWGFLSSLASADEKLRYSLMMNLVDTAWANDELDSNEEKAIFLAQRELKVSNKQLDEIKKFTEKVREIRDRGIDDNYAADAIKTAAATLSGVGVPIAAIFFSGSVTGLSAAGITSGLAGLAALVGLGGMIPGIGVAIVLGTGIVMSVNKMLDTGDESKKKQLQAEKERKAELVIQNMQAAINLLVEKIANLQEKAMNIEASAADAVANREAVKLLTERLRLMQQSVAKRKQAFKMG